MKLKPVQYNAALLIAGGEKLKTVAKIVNVTPATISNWQSIPEFQVVVNIYKADMLSVARDRLIGMSGSVMDALSELISSKNESVRLQACKTILSANGLIGDSEGSFMRAGFGIGPTTLADWNRDKKLGKF